MLLLGAVFQSMKLFKATIVSDNSCYVHTLLIIAENEQKAHEQLCEQQKRKVQYKSKLTELNIDMSKPSVIEYVGFGENESDYGWDD